MFAKPLNSQNSSQVPSNCSACNRQLITYRYYCCDPMIQSCIICNDKICKRCHKMPKNRYRPHACFHCDELVVESKSFFSYHNEQYLCLKCLKQAYMKIQKIYGNALIIGSKRYRSSIECDFEEVQLFLSNYCWKCLNMLSMQEKSYQMGRQIQDLFCTKCLYQREGHREKINIVKQSPISSYKRCNVCDCLIMDNKGMITQDLIVCEVCQKLSVYQEEKLPKKSFIQQQYERQELPDERKNDDQPIIQEDEQYAKDLCSPTKSTGFTTILISEPEENSMSSFFQNSVFMKKSSSFQNMQGLVLEVEKGKEKLQICKGCDYELNLQNSFQNMCRCCYLQHFQKKQKKQYMTPPKTEPRTPPKTQKRSRPESSFKTPPQTSYQNEYEKFRRSQYKEQKYQSSYEKMSKSTIQKEKKANYPLLDITTRKCEVCFKKPALYRYLGKDMCILCKHQARLY